MYKLMSLQDVSTMEAHATFMVFTAEPRKGMVELVSLEVVLARKVFGALLTLQLLDVIRLNLHRWITTT